MIDQVTVFLENEKGRLTAMCRTLGDSNIDMHSLVIADTTDYGIARIICDDPESAVEKLQAAGFRAMSTPIVAVEVPDVPGGLADVLEVLENADMNVEYSYCFTTKADGAINAFKVPEAAIKVLEGAGFRVMHPSDLYKSAK